MLPCLHCFCLTCIDQLVKDNNPLCPVCSETFCREDVRSCLVLNNLLAITEKHSFAEPVEAAERLSDDDNQKGPQEPHNYLLSGYVEVSSSLPIVASEKLLQQITLDYRIHNAGLLILPYIL